MPVPVMMLGGMVLWGTVLSGCIGVNTAKLPNQEIYADDGERRELRGDVGFALVGDSRDPLPLEGGKADQQVREAIIADISEAIQEEHVVRSARSGYRSRTSATWSGSPTQRPGRLFLSSGRW